MAAAVVAQIVGNQGRVLGDLLIFRALAVQDAHGVALEAALAGLAQLVVAGPEIVLQGLAVGGAAFGTAHAVELQPQVLQTQPVLVQVPGEGDDLRVSRGRGGAEDLDAELMELTETAGLGLFVAEHGAHVVELDGLDLSVEFVFHVGAAGRGGVFRTQGQGTAAVIGKGIHLFLHDIGGLAHAALEELGLLKQGGADLAEAVFSAHGAQQSFQFLPFCGVRGQKIVGAAGSENCHYLLLT